MCWVYCWDHSIFVQEETRSLVPIPNSLITFRKGSFTDTWNNAILCVRREHLQEGQCSQSATMWHTYLAWIPSDLPIYWEKCWQKNQRKIQGTKQGKRKIDLVREALGQEGEKMISLITQAFFLVLVSNINIFVQKYGILIYKCASTAVSTNSYHKIRIKIIAYINGLNTG